VLALVPETGSSHHVQGVVELAVAASVEAMPLGLPGGCLDRRGPGQHGEGALGTDACGIADLAEDLGGEDEANALERG
jgi:hypothetical protein